MTQATRADVRATLVLGGAYFANFGGLAASAPFLAMVLRDAGLTDSATAFWLGAFLLARVVATPSWTLLADRTGSIARVLQWVTLGALASFVPLFLPLPASIVVACVAAFSLFRAPFGALLDSITLAEQAAGGAVFGRVRAFGTAGYTLGALATGAVVARMGTRGVVVATVVFLVVAGAASLLSHAKRGAPPTDAPPLTESRFAFLRRPRVVLLLVVATLHQVGLAPYDALFVDYYAQIAGATAAGAAVALGAGAEFSFLVAFAPLVRRWGPARLIRLACVGSAVRWAIIGFTKDPFVLFAVQTLHALTFGAYYVSSVAIVDEETASTSRTTGQGIVGSWSYGVAAALALSLAGFVQRNYGLSVVFRIGAIASAIAALIPLENKGGPARSR